MPQFILENKEEIDLNPTKANNIYHNIFRNRQKSSLIIPYQQKVQSKQKQINTSKLLELILLRNPEPIPSVSLNFFPLQSFLSPIPHLNEFLLFCSYSIPLMSIFLKAGQPRQHPLLKVMDLFEIILPHAISLAPRLDSDEAFHHLEFKYGLTFKHGFEQIPVLVGILYLIGGIVMGSRKMFQGPFMKGNLGINLKQVVAPKNHRRRPILIILKSSEDGDVNCELLSLKVGIYSQFMFINFLLRFNTIYHVQTYIIPVKIYPNIAINNGIDQIPQQKPSFLTLQQNNRLYNFQSYPPSKDSFIIYQNQIPAI